MATPRSASSSNARQRRPVAEADLDPGRLLLFGVGHQDAACQVERLIVLPTGAGASREVK